MAVAELFRRIRANGLVNTFQSAASVIEDWFFDRRYQLETRTEVAINDLDISGEDKQHADKYKPTRVRYFRKLMQQMHFPREGVFVDVGCGKGRILLLAAEHGFDRIVGLEISPGLCEIAKGNVESFSRHRPDLGSIEVVCTNILDYPLKGNETVLFLYSPFDHVVTSHFLKMVRQSIKDCPRDLILVIDEFRYPELLQEDEYFEQTMVYRYGAAVFHVYSHIEGAIKTAVNPPHLSRSRERIA